VDYKVTEKSFAFASKRGAPFFFASASDGTNVVQAFQEAIKLGVNYKQAPPTDFVSDVLSLLSEDNKVIDSSLAFVDCPCSLKSRSVCTGSRK
jgi:hypothetical protein